MQPLIQSDAEVAGRLQQKFGATTTKTPRGVQLQFPGVPECFELSTAHDELTLFAESWHEHFSDVEALESFLEALFSGRVEVVVTYRGETPVAHKLQVRREGKTEVVSRTAILVPLFWKRKSRRTLIYQLSPNQSLERTAGRSVELL